jgi:hypothetical protein
VDICQKSSAYSADFRQIARPKRGYQTIEASLRQRKMGLEEMAIGSVCIPAVESAVLRSALWNKNYLKKFSWMSDESTARCDKE